MSRSLRRDDAPTRLETPSGFNFHIEDPELDRYYAVSCRVNHDGETDGFGSHEAFLKLREESLVFWPGELPTAPTNIRETVNLFGEVIEDPSVKYQLIDKVRYLAELPNGSVVWTSSALIYMSGALYIRSRGGVDRKIYFRDIFVVQYSYEALTGNHHRGVPQSLTSLLDVLFRIGDIYSRTFKDHLPPRKLRDINAKLQEENDAWKVKIKTGKLGELPVGRLALRLKDETLEIYPIHFRGALTEESFLFDEFVREQARLAEGLAVVDLPEVTFDHLSIKIVQGFLSYVYDSKFPAPEELAALMANKTDQPKNLKLRMMALLGFSRYLGLKEYDLVLESLITDVWSS